MNVFKTHDLAPDINQNCAAPARRSSGMSWQLTLTVLITDSIPILASNFSKITFFLTKEELLIDYYHWDVY